MSLNTAFYQSPTLVRLLVERAEHLATRGRWADARAIYATAITADPSPSARIAFGVFLADSERIEEAIQQLEQAWEESKRSQIPNARAVCCQNLSNLYRRLGNVPLANQFQQLATTAEMESEGFQTEASLSCSTLTSSAGLLSDNNEFEAAIRLLGAAAHTSDDDPLARATIEASTGVTLARMGKIGQAIQRLVKAHRLHREAGDLLGCARDLLNIGHLLQSRSHHVEAHRCFRTASDLFTRLDAKDQADFAKQFAQESLRIESIKRCNPSLN